KRDKHDKKHNRSEGRPVLKARAQADAAVVQKREQSGECETDDQPRKKDWLARDPVHLNRVQGWKNVTRDASDGHGFPWADDEVGEDHHPARRKTHCARKDFCRVGHFARSVGHSRNKFSVDVADGKKQSTTKNEAKDPAKRTATQKPVV